MSRFNVVPARALLVAVLASVSSLAGQAPPAASLGRMVDIQIPLLPTPVKVNGKSQLVYELRIDNLSADQVAFTRVSVLNIDKEPTVIGEFHGAQLSSLVAPAGDQPVGPGKSVVVYFWLSLDSATIPRKLKHVVEFDVMDGDQRKQVLAEGGEFTVVDVPPVALGPPLRGGTWAAVYDPSMERGHRRVQHTVRQRAHIPARYAVDWFKIDSRGKTAPSDDSLIADWYGYGAEVLAVADSIVADTRNTIPESSTLAGGGSADTPENASGNYVVLDLGQGRYAHYEHLKPGSIAVKAGDHVRSGQVIAALGYTGDSMGPHLHFHVSDSKDSFAAEGLPYVFQSFEVQGAFESIWAFAEGKRWLPLSGAPVVRMSELPAANTVVGFRELESSASGGQ